MIPKIIHYCWFGGNPMPELAQKCIASWKKYCPNYEIIEWNESNLDFSDCDYAREAYEAKKWAFVSDYARLKIIYENGGVYFDTDVELLRPIDEILEKGAFMGCEKNNPNILVAPGLGMAAESKLEIYKEIIDFYQSIHFVDEDGNYNLTTIVKYTTKILKTHGLSDVDGIQIVAGVRIYPMEYFCPKDFDTGMITITDNSYAIHHFDGSWLSEEEKYADKLTRIIDKKIHNNKTSRRIALIVSFTKYKGLFGMPKAMIRYKINNMKLKKNQVKL